MVGNDIVVIRQMSLLVVVHENYGVSDSSQQGKTWKLWCFWLRLCTLIIFARVQQSDRWCYLKLVFLYIFMKYVTVGICYNMHLKTNMFWEDILYS